MKSVSTITVPFLPLFLAAAIGITGCSGVPKPADLPPLYVCTLKFIQEGEPLAGAAVALVDVSIESGAKWGPMGRTDESGTVEIYTNAKWKGSPAGKYKIVLSKTEMDSSRLPQPATDDPGYEQWAAQAAREVRHTYSLIDKIYTSPETTPLEIEIRRKKTQETFDAGKKVRDRVILPDPRTL